MYTSSCVSDVQRHRSDISVPSPHSSSDAVGTRQESFASTNVKHIQHSNMENRTLIIVDILKDFIYGISIQFFDSNMLIIFEHWI